MAAFQSKPAGIRSGIGQRVWLSNNAWDKSYADLRKSSIDASRERRSTWKDRSELGLYFGADVC